MLRNFPSKLSALFLALVVVAVPGCGVQGQESPSAIKAGNDLDRTSKIKNDSRLEVAWCAYSKLTFANIGDSPRSRLYACSGKIKTTGEAFFSAEFLSGGLELWIVRESRGIDGEYVYGVSSSAKAILKASLADLKSLEMRGYRSDVVEFDYEALSDYKGKSFSFRRVGSTTANMLSIDVMLYNTNNNDEE